MEELTEGKIPYEQLKTLDSELESLKSTKTELIEELNAIDKTLSEIEKSEANHSTDINDLNTDINQYRLLNGQTEVSGPGVIINLKVNDDNYDILYESYFVDYLLLTVNNLNMMEAEAISINDVRILSSTSIKFDHRVNKILINENEVSSPFEVKAIGNSNKIIDQFKLKYGLMWQINSEGIFNMEVVKIKNLSIPRYIGPIRFDYLKPSEDQ